MVIGSVSGVKKSLPQSSEYNPSGRSEHGKAVPVNDPPLCFPVVRIIVLVSILPLTHIGSLQLIDCPFALSKILICFILFVFI